MQLAVSSGDLLEKESLGVGLMATPLPRPPWAVPKQGVGRVVPSCPLQEGALGGERVGLRPRGCGRRPLLGLSVPVSHPPLPLPGWRSERGPRASLHDVFAEWKLALLLCCLGRPRPAPSVQ